MNKKQKKMLGRILAAAAMVVVLMLVPIKNQYLEFGLYMIPYLIVGYDILRKAVKGIMKRQVFDECFLMAVATIGAIVLGEYTEGVAVMLFYQIGELFENYAVGKSRRNISDLMDIRPDYANVERDGEIETVDPDEVEIGSILVVGPGEKVPLDGVVVEGVSSLNTAALTGESAPKDVATGDEIISGCINQSGVLRIRTTKEFGESTVSKILDLVENSSSKKSKSENFITKFAKVYTPTVCYLALALAFVPPIVLYALGMDAQFSTWIYRALIFLVISCPCALVVSIPLSFFAGIGRASHEGILVKGSNYLEALSEVDTVVFDKTGTLTKGNFKVAGFHDVTGNESELLEVAALVESYSSHPISLSLVSYYEENTGKTVSSQKDRVSDVQEVAGEGVHASVDGLQILAGNDKLMKRFGVDYKACNEVGTVVHVAKEGQYLGHILIADEIKETSKEAIKALHDAGVKTTIMLTGDSKAVAEDVAGKIGIDQTFSQLLPGDKVQHVEDILAETARRNPKAKVAFVGDGLNDAPVLTRVDVGIAMGAMGTDAAIEAADVVLMDDDPLKIAKTIRLSRRVLRIVYENIYFAIGVKVLCLILGAVGIANMWIAIFADVGVLVLAILNAIRALIGER